MGKQREQPSPQALVPQFSAPFTGPGKFPTGLSLINCDCWWSERGVECPRSNSSSWEGREQKSAHPFPAVLVDLISYHRVNRSLHLTAR